MRGVRTGGVRTCVALRRVVTVALVYAAAGLLAGAIAQAEMVRLDLPYLVDRCEHAAIGKVVSVDSQWNAAHTQIYNTVRILVNEDLKGNFTAPDNILTLTEPGGTVGETTIISQHAPSFTAGETALVFTETTPDGRLIVLGRSQGKWSLENQPESQPSSSNRGAIVATEAGRQVADQVRQLVIRRGFSPVLRADPPVPVVGLRSVPAGQADMTAAQHIGEGAKVPAAAAASISWYYVYPSAGSTSTTFEYAVGNDTYDDGTVCGQVSIDGGGWINMIYDGWDSGAGAYIWFYQTTLAEGSHTYQYRYVYPGCSGGNVWADSSVYSGPTVTSTSTEITGVAPDHAPAGVGSAGPAGSLVTITGTNFGSSRGPNDHVLFWSAGTDYVYNDSYVASWTDTQIQCYVPAYASSKDLAVYRAGAWSNLYPFTVDWSFWYRWEGLGSMPMGYYVNQAGTPDVPDEFDAVHAAFATWQDVPDCYVRYEYLGTTTRDATNHSDGYNDVAWTESAWPHGSGVIGVSTISILGSTIVEADMELNGQDFIYTTSGVVPNRVDVHNIVMHEAGHGWVGLADLYGVPDQEKTLYGLLDVANGEDKKRTLEPEDMAGAQWIYPCSDPATPNNAQADPTAICEGDSSTLTASLAGAVIDWYTDACGEVLVSTGNSIVVSPAVTTTYYARARDSVTGCESTGCDMVTVVVYPLPTATASNDGPVCEGGDVQLIGGPGAMTAYSWTGPAGFTSSQQNPVVSPAVAGDYCLTVTDGNGCVSAPVCTTVVVYPLPTATASNDGPVCEGGDVQLIGGPGAMTAYSWTGPAGFTSSQQNPVVSPAVAGEYCLTVTDGKGCVSAPACTTVVVTPLVTLIASEPPADGSLPKTQNNLILCTFDRPITLPDSGNPLVITDITNGCVDVSARFAYSIDADDPNGMTLEARENVDPNDPTSGVLTDLTWYQVESAPGWVCVAPFKFEVYTLVGDCTPSARVTTADYSCVKAALGQRGDVRADLNGSGRVTTADYSVVKANLGHRGPIKPALCP